MALETDIRDHAARRCRPHHQLEFRLLYGAILFIFVLSALLSRMLPWNWLARCENSAPRKSIFDEARASTDKIVPLVFMG